MTESHPPVSDQARTATSLRDLADLARAGYAVLSQPQMQVAFEVHHVADRPGYLMEYLEPEYRSSSSMPSFGETLTSGANGLGLVIVTRVAMGVGTPRQYRSSGLMRCEVVDIPTGRIFYGTAQPNPNFIYESAWKYEGLICVDPNQTEVRAWHCRAIHDIVYEVAKLANELQSPILSLQAPAQVPPSKHSVAPDAEEDTLGSAASIAVRFAIALQQPDAATILDLSNKLEEYCRNHGFGFWLADTRLGSRAGNWSVVHDCETNVGRKTRSSRSGGGARYVRHSIPITLVGPARVGATYSLLYFLSQFSEVGIVTCSVTSLDDLLFIHLQLSVASASSEVLGKADSYSAEAASALLPSDALIGLLQQLGLNQASDHGRTGLLVSNMGDYQCLIGPPRQITGGSGQGRMAVWFSWQAQGSDLGLSIPLQALFEAFADVGLLQRNKEGVLWDKASPNIDYLICRNMGNSVLRGKGKLSLLRDASLGRYPYDALEPRPTNMCISIEEAWRMRSWRDEQSGIRELTVAWRECWLGHWSLPL